MGTIPAPPSGALCPSPFSQTLCSPSGPSSYRKAQQPPMCISDSLRKLRVAGHQKAAQTTTAAEQCWLSPSLLRCRPAAAPDPATFAAIIFGSAEKEIGSRAALLRFCTPWGCPMLRQPCSPCRALSLPVFHSGMLQSNQNGSAVT